MTKYQIITPTGVKVCVIEAVSKVTNDAGTYFFAHETSGYKYDNWIADIPEGWAAIPLEVMISEIEEDHKNEWRHAVHIKDKISMSFPTHHDYDQSQVKITYNAGKTWRTATLDEIHEYLPQYPTRFTANEH